MRTPDNNQSITLPERRENKGADTAIVFLFVLLGIFLLLYFVFNGRSVIEKISLEDTIFLIGNPQ
jgi:hypothetical protein